MWPLWLELLLGWSDTGRCLVVDQVEDGRALITDGERVTIVIAPASDGWREGDRLCRFEAASSLPAP